MIVLKEHVNNLFLKYLDSTPVSSLYKSGVSGRNIFVRLCRKISTPIPSFLFGPWKNQIRGEDHIIIFDDGFQNCIANYIRRMNPNIKITLWFWNPVNDYSRRFLSNKNIDYFWTYDRKDAKKYHMRLNTQFYTKNINLERTAVANKVVFLGRDKGRKADINKLQRVLDRLNIETDFTIIEDESQYVSYEKYLDKVRSNKCILDFNASGATGLTLRVMEALFFEKKLITNNTDVQRCDFYKPDNIFILGKDDESKLAVFMDSPYKKIERQVVDYYDYENWLKRFSREEKK